MFQNIVVGQPLVEPMQLLSYDMDDWEFNEKSQTLFTNERFLPRIMKKAGIVESTSEVMRNRPELVVSLDHLDCFWLKYGKRKFYIIVGI